MQILYTDAQNNVHHLDVEVVVKNERVLVCKVAGKALGPYYMHYHSAVGWKDLDHGNTVLSRQMHSIIQNPLELA